ncbi:MAG: hypothetical protein ACRC0K_02690 [Fusobacteriaceae bacterium]
MIKIDRILLRVKGQGISLDEKIFYNIIQISDDEYELKINPGKIENNGDNSIGATLEDAETFVNTVVDGLLITDRVFKEVEYCITIETNFKLRNHKNIIETFSKA